MVRILFVDDDKFFGKPYVDCLKQQFDREDAIDVCTRIADAIHYFHSHKDLSVIILDVMMPPPTPEEYPAEDMSDATEEGFGTGIWYLKLLRAQIIDREVRVFVLTNRNYEDVKGAVAGLSFPDGLIECDRKIAVSANKLPGRVLALLNRAVDR